MYILPVEEENYIWCEIYVTHIWNIYDIYSGVIFMHDMKLKIRGERKKLVREEKKNGGKKKIGSLNIIINIHYIF